MEKAPHIVGPFLWACTQRQAIPPVGVIDLQSCALFTTFRKNQHHVQQLPESDRPEPVAF